LFGFVVFVLAIQRRGPFPVSSRKLAVRCKENDGSDSALRAMQRRDRAGGYIPEGYFGAS